MAAADGLERSMKMVEARLLAMDQPHRGEDHSAKDETVQARSRRRKRSSCACVTEPGIFSTRDIFYTQFPRSHAIPFLQFLCKLIYMAYSHAYSLQAIYHFWISLDRFSTVFVRLELPDLDISMSTTFFLLSHTITNLGSTSFLATELALINMMVLVGEDILGMDDGMRRDRVMRERRV